MISTILNADPKFTPPKTIQKPVTYNMHNFQITDDYQWLEDKDNPEVKSWSKLEHQYTVDFIKNNYSDVAGLREEITKHLDRDVIGAPFFIKNRVFFYSKKKGEQQSKLYTKINNKDILIFDPEKIDPSGKSSINGTDFNQDASILAIGIQKQGNEINEYRIINTNNGNLIAGPYNDVYSWSFTKDDKAAYVSIRSKEIIDKQLPISTYLFKLGDDFKNKKLLITPKDAKDHASLWDSDEGGKTFLTEGDFYSTTLSIRNQNSDDKFKVIYSSKEFQVSPEIRLNKLFIFTNDHAPNFKLMVTDPNAPEYLNWKDIIPENNRVMEGYVITSKYILVQYKEDVLSQIDIFTHDGKFIKKMEIPEANDVSGMGYNKDLDAVFISLSSFTSSSKTFQVNGETLEWKFFYQDILPYNTENIVSKLVFFTSKDGTKIPLFLIHKKDIELNRNNPTLLYGYGGFNISMNPGYVGTTAGFINRGGVYAVACLRGGNEYGENWHRNGMLFKKQNTFDDFIGAAEYLISEKYTNNQKLVVRGGSNGGLLIGAVITQRPDLYKAAICAVPLLDMINYQKFLIARFWIPEYGDPNKKEDFLNIIKYSPYQNINKIYNYPAMLIKAGENDSRVDPLHAKKFAAALQNNPNQKNPIMLFIDFESGHGSGQSINQQVDNIELEWKFIMHNLDMK